jgi:hypothetical protein
LARTFQLLDALAATAPRHLQREIEDEVLPALAAQLNDLRRQRAPMQAFWPGAAPGTWCVGEPDRPRTVPGGRAQVALEAAWRAIAGQLPRCSDLARGVHAERAVRRMLRTTAPAWAARHCPVLAAAFGRILILDGRLQYSEGAAVRVRFASEATRAAG